MTRLAAIPLALVLSLACSDGPADPPPDTPRTGPRGGTATVDGIAYEASVVVMESFPVQIAGRVTMTNETDEPRTVTFPDGCVALLRAYRGEELVWDQAEETGCTMALVPVELAPGGSHEVRTPTSSGYEVLDDEWPDGAYRIAVYLRPGGEQLEIDAGSVDLAIPR